MTNLLLLCRSFQKKSKRVRTVELQQPLCVGGVAKSGSLSKCYTRQSPQQDCPGEYQRSRSEVFQKNSDLLKQILMQLHAKIRKLGIYT